MSFDSTGHIIEQGTFDHLRDANGYIQSLATKHKGEEDKLDDETPVAQTLPHEDVCAQHASAELNRPVENTNTTSDPSAGFGLCCFLYWLWVLVSATA